MGGTPIQMMGQEFVFRKEKKYPGKAWTANVFDFPLKIRGTEGGYDLGMPFCNSPTPS